MNIYVCFDLAAPLLLVFVCVCLCTPVYVFSVLFPIICNTACTGFAHFHGPVSGLSITLNVFIYALILF